MLKAGVEPLPLVAGDVVLARTSASLTLASDAGTKPVDSWARVAATHSTEMHVGEGHGEPVVVRGGRFVFGTADEKLLTGWLPPLVHVVAGEKSSHRVRTLLAFNEAESVEPGPGSEFIIARLMELLLAELFWVVINSVLQMSVRIAIRQAVVTRSGGI